MKKFLLFNLLFSLTLVTSHAQVNLFNPIPKSLKIDFSNPKTPEYKTRYKEYKDSIKTLSKLNKKTLRVALREINKIPGKEDKTKLKNLKEDFKDYKALVKEVDSLRKFEQNVERIKKRNTIHIKKTEKDIARAKRLQYQPVAIWLDENQEDFSFSDSTLSFSQKIKECIENNQYGEIAWADLNTDPTVFLDDYNQYQEYWEEDEDWVKEQTHSTVSSGDSQLMAMADEHFGSYENYQLAKSKVSEIGALLDQAGEYTKAIESLIKGDFQEADQVVAALENRAQRISAMREHAKQMGELESSQQEMQNQIEEMRYKADLQSQYEEHLKGKSKEDVMQKALATTKNLASKHFEGHEEELAEAQEALNQYKEGSINFKNSDKFTAIKSNSLKGKSMGERLVIGGYLQINRKEEYNALDISPQIGYKWTKNYLWGIGGTYRAKFNEKINWIKGEEVYGGRFFMEYNIGKIITHGEYELMSHAILDDQTDKVRRITTPGALAGLGLKYGFIKGMNGNVMVLYNFLYDSKTSPYNSAFVFRFGFNLE